jgi:hypothetical protein
MNQKQIGIIIAIVGIFLLSVLSVIKYQEDNLIDKIVEQESTCFLDD